MTVQTSLFKKQREIMKRQKTVCKVKEGIKRKEIDVVWPWFHFCFQNLNLIALKTFIFL